MTHNRNKYGLGDDHRTLFELFDSHTDCVLLSLPLAPLYSGSLSSVAEFSKVADQRFSVTFRSNPARLSRGRYSVLAPPLALHV